MLSCISLFLFAKGNIKAHKKQSKCCNLYKKAVIDSIILLFDVFIIFFPSYKNVNLPRRNL
ncbi:hypothetical protein HMPREF9441_03371 [Paraprevotella clara YIT 11840]|uniref:Uncharacterized protein n=1 Tax=Paraprevotella clara YIT 11840 TaxID=762968 RepID=G5SV51_9BACT|nr:hypothetical protein HMPREF9441_03371 [Paraprevotella clara YIT 11840]MBD9175826.1 hypothetical protein [Paraprevotella clara]